MVVKKKVVKRVVKKVNGKMVLKVKGGGNRGIGTFVRNYIMECVTKGKELDIKELDGVLFKKFGVTKKDKEGNVSKSRVKSIRWYINDMRNSGKFE